MFPRKLKEKYIMLSIFYLILCFTTGLLIVYLFRNVFITSSFLKHFPKWLLYLPLSFIIGMLVSGWSPYLFALLFANSPSPLFWGNVITMIIQAVATVLLVYVIRKRKIKIFKKVNTLDFLKTNYTEIILVAITTAIISFMMIQSFHYEGDILKMGYSIFSDFGPHTAVMRSFSMGSNFPTEYPHFADGTARYHFMFQFFCGNLEFLGMRLDWAMNLPSIVTFVTFILFFYFFVTIITRKKAIALVSCFLFFFRSSLVFIDFLKDSQYPIIKAIMNSREFVGKTLHEDWGLWAQNVFLNQRHMSFSLCILMIILIVMIPLFSNMMNALRQKGTKIREFFFSKNAWLPESLTRAIVCGVMVGAIGFWNGAVFITILLLLFTIAIFSKNRLEFLIIAAISLVLFLIQLFSFAGSGASTLPSIIKVGFLTEFDKLPPEIARQIAEIDSFKTLMDSINILPTVFVYVVKYFIFPLLGIMPVVALLGMLISKKGSRLLYLVFLTPMVFAFFICITPDIAVNHKYILISIMLLNIFCATLIYYLFTVTKHIRFKNIVINVLGKIIAVAIVITMTTTGFIDLYTEININKNHSMISEKDPTYLWVKENTSPHAVFLTEGYVLGPILFAGRKVSSGHGYYAFSAGYDTHERFALIVELLGSRTPEELRERVKKLDIDYIVTTPEMARMVEDGGLYNFNNSVIAMTYPLVFEEGSLQIFKVR